MNRKSIHHLVMAAIFLNLGLVLPFLAGHVPTLGAMLLPMHLPVLLCGIILGPRYGALVGLILPLTSSLILGMPPLFPNAVSMTFELATYGGIIGLLYGKLPRAIPFLYASLIGAMLAGRAVWAVARVFLLGLADVEFSFELFLAGAFINAIPGIIVQIVLIPILILSLQKAGWNKSREGVL